VRSSLVIRACSGDHVEPGVFAQAASVTIDLSGRLERLAETRRHAVSLLTQARRVIGPGCLFAKIDGVMAQSTDADLAALLRAGLDGIVLSGCRSGEDVQHLGTKLAVHEAEIGLTDGTTKIIAVAACDAAALFRMESYAGSSARLAGIAWDAERLSAALGIETPGSDDPMPAPLVLGRTLTVVAARASGVPAIDTACGLTGHMLVLACENARRDGFAAKFATSSEQLRIIGASFAA
jgi:citrate lyase subunit beta/citryl-CoA lyase